MVRPLCCGVFALLGVCRSLSEPTRPLLKNELDGIRLWRQDDVRVVDAEKGNESTYSGSPCFLNDTPFELANLVVRFTVGIGGRRVFTGDPISLKSFGNGGVPCTGSLLPFEKSDPLVPPLRFRFPGRFWMNRTFGFQIVGASVFTNTDLHNVGHLFTFFQSHREPEVLKKLKQDPSLVTVSDSRGFTASLAAFGTCDTAIIKYVLTHGGSTKPSNGGSTIMHLASINPNPGVQSLALALGGKVNDRTKGGNSPLDKAILLGKQPDWRWLLAHGADPNAINSRGFCPLGMAVEEGQAAAIPDLKKAGADIHRRDAWGLSLMERAVNHPAMLPAVVAAGFDVNASDSKTGRTALMYAASKGDVAPEDWLLRHKANPDLQDKHGRTAFDYARKGNPQHTDRYFRELVKRIRG